MSNKVQSAKAYHHPDTRPKRAAKGFWTERDRRHVRRYHALGERDPASPTALQPVFDSRDEAVGMRDRLSEAAAVLMAQMRSLTPASSPTEFGSVRTFLHEFLLYVRVWEAGAFVFSGDLRAGYRFVGEMMKTDAFRAYNRERVRRYQDTPAYKTRKKGYDADYRSRPEIRERRCAAAEEIARRERTRYHRRRLLEVQKEAATAIKRHASVIELNELREEFSFRAARVLEELGVGEADRRAAVERDVAQVFAAVAGGTKEVG